MKSTVLSIMLFSLTLIPGVSQAQFHVDPIGGPAGPGMGMMQPRRVGFIHEFSGVVSGLTGEGKQDFVAGAGGYYSGLFRSNPNFAFGIHAGVSGATSVDGFGNIVHGVVAGEARIYIPLGPMMEMWGSLVVGGGSLKEIWTEDDGTETGNTRTGPVFGAGAGISWFISPNISVGGFFRLYRLMWKDDGVVEFEDGTEYSESDYYGLWWTVGGFVALHY
ncbi:MAG: hypothetical protein JXR95_09335 [Deltaproteobacteria bacterium]|nr:hypothetical protein [Deltaproteobacteria bacterium]